MHKQCLKLLSMVCILIIVTSIPVFANNNVTKFIIKLDNSIIDLKKYVAFSNNEFKGINKGLKPISRNRFYISSKGIKMYIEFRNDKKPFAVLSVYSFKNRLNDNILNISSIPASKPSYYLLDINIKEGLISISDLKPIKLTSNSNYTLLVNKNNPISSKFAPNNLVYLKGKINAVMTNNMRLEKNAALELSNMIKAANKQGINGFIIKSAYRTYNEQNSLYFSYFNKFKKLYPKDYEKITSKYVQKPGRSEHQTGLALDISSKDRNKFSSFEQTSHYKWLKQNCWKFGFIIRYPKDKTKITGMAFEPWHLRYVGKPVAEIIYRNNWTLEEYKNYINKNKFIIYKSFQGKYYMITYDGYHLISR